MAKTKVTKAPARRVARPVPQPQVPQVPQVPQGQPPMKKGGSVKKMKKGGKC